jgi:hypothetical protein
LVAHGTQSGRARRSARDNRYQPGNVVDLNTDEYRQHDLRTLSRLPTPVFSIDSATDQLRDSMRSIGSELGNSFVKVVARSVKNMSR